MLALLYNTVEKQANVLKLIEVHMLVWCSLAAAEVPC